MSPARGDTRIVLGGVGGDAHSVGLIVLRGILLRAGFHVHYLGTQNDIAELCVAAAAAAADAVLVSNMDGHAPYYLRDLPAVQRELGVHDKPWYLGGHPSVHTDDESLAALRRLGFRRVFPRYLEASAVVAMLDDDLGVRPSGRDGTGTPAEPAAPDVTTEPGPAVLSLPARTVDEQREEVLAGWHTGQCAVDVAANAATLRDRRTLSEVQRLAARDGRTLIHPRAGTARPDEQLALLRALADAGADVLSFQIDSLTRNNAYSDVERALKESLDTEEQPGLNGYPAVNHGVPPLRAITEELAHLPLQVRHSTRDPRLLAEISFAAGVTAFEGGAITYNLPYYRDYPPVEALAAWRYVDALAGRYRRRYGVVIDREFFGVLTAGLVPPCLAVVATVLEALLAAREGVGSVSLGYAEQGHRAQDIAAIRALPRVAARYLDRLDLPRPAVYTVFHQYMGAFPGDPDKARALLRGSAVTARLSGATRLMLKTYVEAVRIPRAEDNVASLALVAEALAAARPDQADWAAVAAEEELIVAESCAILDAALRAGGGRPDAAVVAAIGRGYLDVPFSPSRWNAGRAMAVRDLSGAVRFADPGQVPLPAEVRDRHATLVRERHRAAPGRSVEELVETDVLRSARGGFITWPLG